MTYVGQKTNVKLMARSGNRTRSSHRRLMRYLKTPEATELADYSQSICFNVMHWVQSKRHRLWFSTKTYVDSLILSSN